MFRKLRIAVLLAVLVNVAVGAWLMRMRTTSWEVPVRVAVFPVAADASPATGRYIDSLDRERFREIEDFFREEAARHGVSLRTPVEVRLGPRLAAMPPAPPFGGSRLEILLWSLELRAWVWKHGDVDGPKPHARLFLLYHDPDSHPAVPHSVGLPQGLIGVVHLFASRAQARQNAVVIAHELLHTLGATDKYDPETNLPVHPDGYAEPDRVPRLPQAFAELMGGRKPVSTSEAVMPDALSEVLVGVATAREIGWRR